MAREMWAFLGGSLIWWGVLYFFQAQGRRHAPPGGSWLRPANEEGRRARRSYFVATLVGFLALIAWGFFGIAKIQNR